MLGVTRKTIFAMAEGIIRLGNVAISPVYKPDLIGELTSRARIFVAIPRIVIDPIFSVRAASVGWTSNLLVVRWHVLTSAAQQHPWELVNGHLFLYEDGSFVVSSRTQLFPREEGKSVWDAIRERVTAARENDEYDWAAEAIYRLYDRAISPSPNVLWAEALGRMIRGEKDVPLVVYGWGVADLTFVPGRGLRPADRGKGGGRQIINPEILH